MKKDWNNMKDSLEGKIVETTGKITDNEQLELKGKMKSIKSDIKNIGEDIKEKLADNANDFIDKMRKDR